MVLAEIARSLAEAESENFGSDLRRTYDFLHLNLLASKATFSDRNAAK